VNENLWRIIHPTSFNGLPFHLRLQIFEIVFEALGGAFETVDGGPWKAGLLHDLFTFQCKPNVVVKRWSLACSNRGRHRLLIQIAYFDRYRSPDTSGKPSMVERIPSSSVSSPLPTSTPATILFSTLRVPKSLQPSPAIPSNGLFHVPCLAGTTMGHARSSQTSCCKPHSRSPASRSLRMSSSSMA